MHTAFRRLIQSLPIAFFWGIAPWMPPRPSLSSAVVDRMPGSVHARSATTPNKETRPGATESSRGYHQGILLICTDCHVFGATAIPPDPARNAIEPPAGPDSRPLSLRFGDLTELCLDCHDGRPGVPDVVAEDVNGLRERTAGYFAGSGQVNHRGHDLASARHVLSDPAACGGCHAEGESPGVTCIDCHDPHGNGNPRNLRWNSDPDATPPLGLFIRPGARGLARYERANVAYGTRNSDQLREVTSLCLDCHHLFSGRACTDPDQDGIHSRHPSYDSERGSPVTVAQGAVRGTTDSRHWARGAGAGFEKLGRLPFVTRGASTHAEASRVDPAVNGVFCLTCHKAHGGPVAFGLNWPQAGAAARAGCDQCHRVDAGDGNGFSRPADLLSKAGGQ